MKKRSVAVLVCSAISIAVAAWTHFAAGDPPSDGPYAVEIDPVPATAGGNPGINYSTGFEPEEGFPLGYISNTPGTHPAGCGGPAFPCWGHTTAANASLITPTIENLSSASGVQHLRLMHDPTTRTNTIGFGLGIDARYPRPADRIPRPAAPNTVSVDIAISNTEGMSFRVQPQSNSQGLPATSVLFHYTGEIYVYFGSCESGPFPTGFQWDTTGAYQNFTVALDPCAPHEEAYGGYGVVNFYYGGNLIFSNGCPFGTSLDEFLVFGDNYSGSHMDVDNVVMTSLDECPHTCGNGIYEPWAEQCESGLVECNPGHTCGAPGTAGECTCNRICTLDAPCDLTNGVNGPFYGPFDASFVVVFVYDAPAGVDAVSVELCGSTGIDQRIYYFGSCTDPGDPGVTNDDCYPGYAGADPSASCYGTVTAPNYESCTCHDNPLAGDNCYLMQVRDPGAAGQVTVEVNKKAVCGQGHIGACCDTNNREGGDLVGCTDNALQSACTGVDKVWTENGKCASTVCECIPDCTGRNCGDDGCGGSCGSCDDGVACTDNSCDAAGQCVYTPNNPLCNDNIACTVDTCNLQGCVFTPDHQACSNNNVCDGIEQCEASSGCVPGGVLICDNDVFCDGVESCDPIAGCQDEADPCDPATEECDEVKNQCEPSVIPTVSQWGLVVLTIILLVAAKVQFGRRRSA